MVKLVEGKLLKGEQIKSCKTCYWDWVIRDTLNASEGKVDLTNDFCFGCVNFSSWEELKTSSKILKEETASPHLSQE